MDIFGISILELLVALVVALVVLGPAKTVKMARSAGRMLGEVRRALTDLSSAIEEEERQTEAKESADREGTDPPKEPG